MQQALNFLKDLHRVIEVKLPDISHVPLHNIDYRQPFLIPCALIIRNLMIGIEENLLRVEKRGV